jgi:hypothetical protein
MKPLKKFFTTIDRFVILKEFIMFIPSTILSIISFQTNLLFLIIGLFFVVLSVAAFLKSLIKFIKERNRIDLLKAFVMEWIIRRNPCHSFR